MAGLSVAIFRLNKPKLREADTPLGSQSKSVAQIGREAG